MGGRDRQSVMDWSESGKKIRGENEEACLGVTDQTQKEKETVKVRCKSESESAGEKRTEQ